MVEIEGRRLIIDGLRSYGVTMSENTSENEESQEPSNDDSKADAIAIAVIFVAAVLMAAHLISGFTIDV